MSSSSTSRHDLIQNAVLFLQDPKTQSSPLTAKIEFLQSKGLDESEIQEALSRSASSPASSSHSTGHYGGSRGGSMSRREDYGMRYEMAPVPPKRDWRDMFIMAVVSGGVAYGLATLAKKYLVPHLQPPSTTAFQSTSAEITAQYDEAARLMAELQEQTGKLQSTLDEDRERVNKVVSEVEEAVSLVRSAEDTWREEMRDVRGEIEGIRELVPRMIEKHSVSQSSALSDLQSELKSLKTLLLSRQNIPQPPTNTSGTSPPNGPASSTGTPASTTTSAANALLGAGKSGGRSIPAWQMAPSKSESGTTASGWSEAESMSGSGLSEMSTSGESKGKEKE